MFFQPIRFVLLLGIAFVAGILYERNEATVRCVEHGGEVFNGICEQ